MMRGRRLQFRQIAAGIDEGALHRLGAPQQGAILLERGDGDDRGAERGLRHRPEIGPAAESAKEACPTLPLTRSEEHTSELQSLMRISYAVFCLKKKNIYIPHESVTVDTLPNYK